MLIETVVTISHSITLGTTNARVVVVVAALISNMDLTMRDLVIVLTSVVIILIILLPSLIIHHGEGGDTPHNFSHTDYNRDENRR